MNAQQTQPQQELEASSPVPVSRTPFQRIQSHFARRALAGLLVLIPLLATILVLRFVFVYVDGIFRGPDGFFTPLIEGTPLDFPGVGVVFAVLLLYFVGLVVAAKAGRRAIEWQHAILIRIPIVKSIYGVAKQATDALTSPMGRRFSRVVFIDWPRPGAKALGFVTGHCHSPTDKRGLVLVYIPTVPNPTSGNLAFMSEDEIIETNLSVEDAMKLVLSGGIVVPETLTLDPEQAPTGLTHYLEEGEDEPVSLALPMDGEGEGYKPYRAGKSKPPKR
ncbi:MAG: DUF502 domain-containing protein [Chloroflexi bacterium]|nr:DUF502 domain-containing protein [Chloroflexota bacterium]